MLVVRWKANVGDLKSKILKKLDFFHRIFVENLEHGTYSRYFTKKALFEEAKKGPSDSN